MVTRGAGPACETGPVLPAVGMGTRGEKCTGVRSPYPPPRTVSFLPLMPRCCGPSSVLLHSSGARREPHTDSALQCAAGAGRACMGPATPRHALPAPHRCRRAVVRGWGWTAVGLRSHGGQVAKGRELLGERYLSPCFSWSTSFSGVGSAGLS